MNPLRALAIPVVATALAGVAADEPKPEARPVVGDWRPKQVQEKSGVRVEVKRLTIRQWTDPIRRPDELVKNDGYWEAEDYFLQLGLGILVGGVPYSEAEALRSTGPIDVDFDGRVVDSRGIEGSYRGTMLEDHVTVYHKIEPWSRGTGPGRIRVRECVTLKSGKKVDFEFFVPVK